MPVSKRLIASLRLAWRTLIPRALREASRSRLERRALDLVLRGAVVADRPPSALKRGPLVVSGFFSESSGVAQAGRLTADALEAAGEEPIRHDLRTLLAQSPDDASLPGEGGCWLIHANPAEARAAMYRLGPAAFHDRYRIAYWAWEQQAVPQDWLEATRLFDEIWVPSQFVADALRGSACPIRVMPHPVPVPIHPPRRDHNVVNFLAMADARSNLDRKNVEGAALAFQAAFPQPTPRTRLVIKVQNAPDPGALALRLNPSARSDIEIIDRTLAQDEVFNLTASADIFVSLHRSEGFGLVLAETMAMGIPVIATRWSGNLDFMDDDCAALIDAALVTAPASAGVYAGRQWADPDLSAAAQAMRRLAADSHLRETLGQRGRSRIAALSAPWSAQALSAMPFHAWTT